MSKYFSHPSSVIDNDCAIGDDTKVWHFCHIMKGTTIGKNCVIGQNVFVGQNTQIGSGVKIQNNVSIYEGVECSDDVFIGPSVVFTNVINPRSFVNRKSEFKATFLKKGATIGANATILCGVSLGAYCMIGAGSVVTKDVADYQLVVGNPAKSLGWVSKNGDRLSFSDEGIAHCDSSNETYRLIDDNVTIEG